MTNPYQAYKQQSVLTMTPGDMLTMVYDGLLKSLYQAAEAFEAKDNTEINRSLQKGQEILTYLKNTLNLDYEVSGNLASLYDFFISSLGETNVKKQPGNLKEVTKMIADLRGTFVEADRKVRQVAATG